MERRIAVWNLKYYKNKNIIIGIAVFLTCFLLYIVPATGYNMVTCHFAAINKLYPTWHAVFRDVDSKTADRLSAHHDVTVYGLRSDIGSIVSGEANIALVYLDEEGCGLYRIAPAEGNFPAAENEIMVSEGILKALGSTASLGDTITIPYQVYRDGELDYVQEKEFKICGLLENGETNGKQKSYTAVVSREFLLTEIPEEQILYYFLFQVTDKENAVTDDFEETIYALAGQFGLKEEQIGINKEFLAANYVDPSTIPAIAGIMLIVIAAGIITIYSIYYVNMPERIREFGKYKSIGATKRQLRKIVFWEGFLVSLSAMPLALIAGTLCTKIILVRFIGSAQKENSAVAVALNLLERDEILLYHWWIYFLAIAVTLLTVGLSLQKPMRVASAVSEIEAMRFEQTCMAGSRNQKMRKSFTDITIFRITGINLTGNKRKTMITILSMGSTGIFIMIIATILACANPRESANQNIFGQYHIALNTESHNKEHPERAWDQVIRNNPLDGRLKDEVMQIKGVKSASVFQSVNFTSDSFEGDLNKVRGVPGEWADYLMDGIIDGSVTYEELKSGEKVIMDVNLTYWYPDIKVGDTLELEIPDGEEGHVVSVEIAAVGEYSLGFTTYGYLLMAEEGIAKLTDKNVNGSLHIFADQDYSEEIYQALQELVSRSEFLQIETWKSYYEVWKSGLAMITGGCYAFLMILSAICIMNLINTMINSVHVRKKEIGMLQAVGMTDRQLISMLQQESLFYTIGTLVVSIGAGSALGYPVFLWAKRQGMFNISSYHYPYAAAFVVLAVLVMVQTVLSVVLGKMLKRESLIERIRFKE